MASKLSAHESPISRIFSNDYVFHIPGYQRPYAWTTEQARDLFEDLTGFMEGREIEVENMPPYFLGSIVLIKGEDSSNADIVDGQQRLTTLTLLLSAIRSGVTERHASDITQLIYEKSSRILGSQDRFRLTLRPLDRDFFRDFVQREGGFAKLLEQDQLAPGSQRRLRENAQLFNDRLAVMPEDGRIRLAEFIVNRCFLVVVTTPDLDSAYRIFSVLNSRGLDLAPTDILKAELIGAVSAPQRDSYTSKWENLEEDIGREEFVELFSHVRMVYRKAKPQGTMLKEFKEHVTQKIAPTVFIDDILLPLAQVFEEVTDSAYQSAEGAGPVNESLKWLNRLEFNDWIPPALAFSTRWRHQPSKMAMFFNDLERLSYFLLVTRRGINERIERFSRLTRTIENASELSAIGSPLQLSPVEQYQTFETLSGPIYESLSARARSLVLLRLDSLMAGGGAIYDYDTITVEHVLPQNPPANSEWLAWFPDPIVRTLWTHRLGNLALLTRKKNSAASNYGFATKKSAYFARAGVSPFVLTTQVLQHGTWTPVVVEARQRELEKKLEVHWRLGDREDPTTALLNSL